MAFVHLHNHTEYSLLDGATHIIDMVRRAARLGMPAIAVTDHGVMSGIPELADACAKVEKDTGVRVKPIFGCEVYFTLEEEARNSGGQAALYHMLLLAKSNKGYHNLVKLVSRSHVENFYYKPQTTFSLLEQYSEGIIATSACLAGIVPRMIEERRYEDAVAWARKLAALYEPGDFYIELQDQGITLENGMTQNALNHELKKLADEVGCKTVATNDIHYLTREDSDTQDILLCVGTGSTKDDPNRLRFTGDQFYMKTEEEMREVFHEFPDACDNTVELAAKCDVELERETILPNFPLPEGETQESFFRKKCLEGLCGRYGEPLSSEVVERYEHEAKVIIDQGFPAYFLVVQEFVQWAKDKGIGVGPGRGSAAGSIVSYALGITDLEPLSNGLIFERFLSVERVEMPDIDIDFDDERRDEVIAHVKEVYGEDHVASVITFGTLKAKNAIRDAARVLNFPYGLGDRLCKMIGNDLGVTIARSLETNPELKAAYEKELDAKAILDAALSLEGFVRGEGVHACAVIICRDPLDEHIPMKRDTKGGDIITQYDGHHTPDLGLLKMDFLGLRNLSVISRACRNVKERHAVEIDPLSIPLDDEKAFKLMGGGNMDGLFQVESALYVSLFAKMKPRSFADIVASIALNRPGPLGSGMVDEYARDSRNPASVAYPDDRLRPILEETYGKLVYQEQIMQISMTMCGFSAGKADRLRKAMGKKDITIMDRLKEDWNDGAVQNGYSLDVAKNIWNAAEKFAEYAFNKSHSAAYAVTVMRTAYLKAHYPVEFMAAVLSSFMGKADRLIKYIASCNHSGIPVLPPDVNSSNLEFTATDEGIRFGLAGVRGVGEKAAERIIEERKANGPYTSLHDYVNRLDSGCYNRKVLDALIKGGAFDSTGYTRRQMMYFVDGTNLLEAASQKQKDRDSGQMNMFDLFDEGDDSGFVEEIPKPDGVEWDRRTLLAYEKEIMKIYISDHPLKPYEAMLARLAKHSIADGAESENGISKGVFAGMVTALSTRMTKRNTKMASFNLEDTTGMVECICFKYEDFEHLIQEDAVIKVQGKYEHNDRGDQIVAFQIESIDLNEKDVLPLCLEIRINSADFNQQRSLGLNKVLQAHPGRDGVTLFVRHSDGKRFRAQLPLTVDSRNSVLRSKIQELFENAVEMSA